MLDPCILDDEVTGDDPEGALWVIVLGFCVLIGLVAVAVAIVMAVLQ